MVCLVEPKSRKIQDCFSAVFNGYAPNMKNGCSGPPLPSVSPSSVSPAVFSGPNQEGQRLAHHWGERQTLAPRLSFPTRPHTRSCSCKNRDCHSACTAPFSFCALLLPQDYSASSPRLPGLPCKKLLIGVVVVVVIVLVVLAFGLMGLHITEKHTEKVSPGSGSFGGRRMGGVIPASLQM